MMTQLRQIFQQIKIVLLQTAYVEIKNPSHSQKTNAHLLFDSGSQRSYISKTLHEELKLPTIGQKF